VLGGALEVAQRTVRLAQVGVIGGVPQVQGDGPPDTLGSLTVIPLLMASDAKQVQGVGVVGLGAEDAAVAPDGLGQQSAPVFLQGEGKLVVHGDALSVMGQLPDPTRFSGAKPKGRFANLTSRCSNNGRL
jgi:hypothetical protein